MNRLRPSLIVCPTQRVTVGGSSRRRKLNAHNQKGTHEVTTKTTLPMQGMTCTGCENNIRFAHTSLEGVRRVNPDHRAKSVEVGYRVVGS